MQILNNREIATLIWFAIIVAWALWKAKIGPALVGLLRSLSNPKILRAIACMASYVALSVWLLARIDLWHLNNIKTTIIWFGSFCFGSIFNLTRFDADPGADLRKVLRGVLNLTVIVTFLTEFYTFNLFGELALVPAIAVLVLFHEVTKGSKGMESAERLFGGVLSLLGWGLLIHAGYRLISDLRGFVTAETGREFALPALLSLMFLPFMYAFSLYVAYEQAFVSMPYSVKDSETRRYARWKAVRSFGLNVKLLRRWRGALHSLDTSNRNAIDASIMTIKRAWHRERNPPRVASNQGWSPYAAIAWLKHKGIETREYNPSFGGWSASSLSKRIGEGASSGTIAYSVIGNEQAATQLELTLNLHRMKGEKRSAESLAAFEEASRAIFVGAFGDKADQVARRLNNKRRCTKINKMTIKITEDDWSVDLIITHDAHVDPYGG